MTDTYPLIVQDKHFDEHLIDYINLFTEGFDVTFGILLFQNTPEELEIALSKMDIEVDLDFQDSPLNIEECSPEKFLRLSSSVETQCLKQLAQLIHLANNNNALIYYRRKGIDITIDVDYRNPKK